MSDIDYKRAWMNAEMHLLKIHGLCSRPFLGENEQGRMFRDLIMESIADDAGKEATDEGLRQLRVKRGLDPIAALLGDWPHRG